MLTHSELFLCANSESAMKSELEGKSLHCEMSRESDVNEFEEVDGFTGEVRYKRVVVYMG